MTKSVDLLGNDIVKSIEKANLLYEGQAADHDLGQLFKSHDLVSSEDDLEFKPVTSGKKKRRKNKQHEDSSSSFVDDSSESSDAPMEARAPSPACI